MRPAQRRVVLGLYRSGHDRGLLETALDLGVTVVDTAFNYYSFASHKALADLGADLLDRFEVTTKVGYFPDGHSLDPGRLRAAVRQSVADLGRIPDTILVHNPENYPAGLAAAADTLREAVAAGLCKRWGISSWDLRPLLPVLAKHRLNPDVLMTRAGITVPAGVLEAADRAAAANQTGGTRRGMAPFAGDPQDPAWTRFDAKLLLRPNQPCTPIQATFAAAFLLPDVSEIAVGTSNSAHLTELVEATNLEPDSHAVNRYRDLLARAATVASSPTSRSAA